MIVHGINEGNLINNFSDGQLGYFSFFNKNAAETFLVHIFDYLNR